MSETDSFIEEVTEEVRRDKLFAFFRKYLWAFIGLVVLIVGGAAVNEYMKSADNSRAQAAGEALRAAAKESTLDAFAPLADSGTPAAIIAKMDQVAVLVADGKTADAASLLTGLASAADTPPLFKDLSLLKLVMINGENMNEGELFDILDKLSADGAPFRLLGMEQRAIANVRLGHDKAAKSDLVQILVDASATQGLRNRAQQLTVALGGAVLPAVPATGVTTNGG